MLFLSNTSLQNAGGRMIVWSLVLPAMPASLAIVAYSCRSAAPFPPPQLESGTSVPSGNPTLTNSRETYDRRSGRSSRPNTP
jgi:hypothetical protein